MHSNDAHASQVNSKLTICDAGNVTVPAFLALTSHGYSVRCESASEPESEIWIAEKETTKLLADDILKLLGLAAIIEWRGKDWKATDPEIQDFMKKYGYTDAR